jgi:uncharacterized protein YbjT (DUF2867 family)
MIVVTGATGTVGSETVRQLAGAHHQVRALVRDPAKAAKLDGTAEVVVADLASPHSLAAAFVGADRAFVISPVTPELGLLEANAFRAAAEAGVRHIVKLSNFGAGSFPTSIWHWHQESENTLRGLGIPWTVLRPARFMPDTPFSWTSVTGHGTIFESTGDSLITLIDPRDVAAVAATVLTAPGHEGKTYELTAAEALTGTQIAQKVAVAIGRPVTFTDTLPDVLREAMLAAGAPEFITEMVLQYFTLVRQGRMHVTTTVADLLGRSPRSYDEWLQENAQARIQHAA